MAFGFAVDDYTQATIGLYGYVLELDISIYLPDIMKFVQATNVDTDVDDPNESPEGSLAALQALANDSDCPDLAWYYSGDVLYILFNEATYPYADGDARFAYSGLQRGDKLGSLSDAIEIPAYALDLFVLFIKQNIYKDVGHTSRRILHLIEKEKVRIEGL